MPLVLSGDGSVGPLSATEVGYLDGVTSAVQTQIDAKLDIAGGKVLQVVSAVYSTTVSSTSTSFVNTGLSASITPSSTSSKVLVIVTQSARTDRTSSFTAAGVFQILRTATGLFVGQSEQFGIYVQASSQDLGWRGVVSMVYLDSPSTTSATTYQSQMRAHTSGHSVTAQPASNPSSIVLMEVSA